MKKFLRTIALCLIVPVIMILGACGKKDGGKVDPPSTPPTQNEENNEQEEILPSLSNSDAFLLSYNLLDEFCKSESGLKTSYLNEIERMANMINSVYEIEDLKSGFCSKGKLVSEIENSDSVNRLAKIILDEDSNDQKISVSVKMLFEYKDLDINFDYKFYHITIDVDKTTSDVLIKTYSDSSAKYGKDDSTGRYTYLSVAGKLGEDKVISKLSYCEFDRSSMIDEVSNETITHNYIKNFEGIVLENGQQTKEYLAYESDLYMSKLNSEQVVLARESVVVLVAQLRKIMVTGTLSVLSNASELMVPIVNA